MLFFQGKRLRGLIIQFHSNEPKLSVRSPQHPARRTQPPPSAAPRESPGAEKHGPSVPSSHLLRNNLKHAVYCKRSTSVDKYMSSNQQVSLRIKYLALCISNQTMKGKIIHQKVHYFQIYKLCARVKKIKCPLVQSCTRAAVSGRARREVLRPEGRSCRSLQQTTKANVSHGHIPTLTRD